MTWHYARETARSNKELLEEVRACLARIDFAAPGE